MSTINATPSPAVAPSAEPVDNYLTYTRGFLSWALTLDHKRIGVMYMFSVLFSFLIGGIFALLVRTELLTPGPTIPGVDANTYNQFFTLHGAIMVFLVIIPSIPAALGNFVLPVMLGAKDVAFPRLNLGSYYLWIIGAICAVASLLYGGFDTGWTFYTPYSTTTTTGGVIPVIIGVFILGFSSIFTGINFVVTIHKLRPPGMTWFRMPLFLWALYATALIQVLATPVLGITLLMLIVERVAQIGLFDPAMGGDPVLYQHFFWFYSHPAVYIMILPAMGIISEIISVHAHRHIFGYRFIAFSSVAIAIFSFLVWGHHMFTSGQSPLMNTLFSAITFSVAIPSAIKVFNWLATLYKGSISLNTPMLYGLGFIFLFTIGGLTLRGRPLPLRDDGFGPDRDDRRPAPLVAQDVRPHVQRAAWSDRLLAGVHRVQRDLLHAVHARQPGHAAPLLQLSARVPELPRDLDHRVVHHGPRFLLDRVLPALLAGLGPQGPEQPVGRSQPRVAVHLAAAARQLQDHPLGRRLLRLQRRPLG